MKVDRHSAGGNMITRPITALVPWLACAGGFAPESPAFSGPRTSAIAFRRGGAPTTALSSSVNDDASGFHYDQEPRGTSYMSQLSKQDLWERRQVRRGAARQRQQRSPNSRGAFPPRPQYGPINGGQYGGPVNGGGPPMPPIGAAPGSEFDAFKESVSTSLKSMTDLLREMQESQTAQSTDVQVLSSKVANLSGRLGQADAKNRMVSESAPMDTEIKNFGTSLDGEFHQKIKDVVDQFSIVDRGGSDGSAGQGGGEQIYGTKIAQLEAKINRIDGALKATEDQLDSQMEFVDRLVGGGLDDEQPGFDGMPFQQQPPPEPFLPDGAPPPFEERLPQPPPPPPVAEEEGPSPFMDDGRSYFQERNYNDPNNIPPRPENEQQTKSVNTRSDAHHYTEPNNSFVSSFSKMDNDRRKEFRPFDRAVRREAMGVGEQVLPRGAPRAANRQYAMPPPPPPEPMGPGYYEDAYMYGEGPMMMEDEMLFDGGGMMYEF
ncbi:hypothetical protein ACHAXT_012188 [Thalassiosira profunda]